MFHLFDVFPDLRNFAAQFPQADLEHRIAAEADDDGAERRPRADVKAEREAREACDGQREEEPTTGYELFHVVVEYGFEPGRPGFVRSDPLGVIRRVPAGSSWWSMCQRALDDRDDIPSGCA